jgi:hypothetical protein
LPIIAVALEIAVHREGCVPGYIEYEDMLRAVVPGIARECKAILTYTCRRARDWTLMVTDAKTGKIVASTSYALKCRPTPRMF